MTTFRTRLGLEHLSERVVPDGTPTDPPFPATQAQLAAADAQAAQAAQTQAAADALLQRLNRFDQIRQPVVVEYLDNPPPPPIPAPGATSLA